MQEMSVISSGADASIATGGVRINYVRANGGNSFKGPVLRQLRQRFHAGHQLHDNPGRRAPQRTVCSVGG